MRRPAAFYRRCRARYGDTFTVRGADGTVVTTTDPELVRVLFAGTHDELGASVDLTEPALGPGSVFLLSGDEARRERRLLTPPFTGRRLQSHSRLMWEVAERHAAGWSTEHPVVLHQVLNAISLEIIVRCIFGIEERVRLARCCHLVDTYVGTFFPPALYFRALRRPWFPFWNRFTEARDSLRAFLHTEVERRRRGEGTGGDILSHLVEARYEDGAGMDDERIVDELITLLLAGHETTSIALTWALYWLERHSDALRRAEAEVLGLGRDPDPEAAASLPWLDAVCKESLRLHPIASRVTRRVRTGPFRFGPWIVPEGLAVGASITAVHEREEVYDRPLEFVPERFLERRFGPHEYLPFGGGIRRCLGAAFGEREMRLVLACVLRRYRFRAVSRAPARPRRRSVTMAPAGGVPVRLTPR